jgi:hypothetical protein
MTIHHIRPTQVLVGVIVGALLVGGGYAIAASRSTVIHGCVNKKTHALTVTTRCGKGTTVLTWNQRGPAGAKGASGATGAAATVSVGSVSTGTPGSPAAVTNVGAAGDAKLNFTIPAGQNGTDGTDGTNTGPDAYGQVWMGSSAAELAPGNNQNVTSVGSGGIGTADVDVEGCSTAGLAEPVINVTADHDDADTLTGANDTANTAVAWVAHWSTEPDFPILEIEVQTTNPTGGAAVNSDFAIAVNC